MISARTCPLCLRTEISLAPVDRSHRLVETVLHLTSSPICEDCAIILFAALDIGALALRKELARLRQLDLFDEPRDRVLRALRTLEGKDAPSS